MELNYFILASTVAFSLIGILGVQESFSEISDITYDVTGGEIQEIKIVETQFKETKLVIKIEMVEDGNIFLEIPKSVWNLADPYCREASSGIVIDNKFVEFSEEIDETKRSFTGEIPKGTNEIQITQRSTYVYDIFEEGQRCFLIEQTKNLPPKSQMNAGLLPKDVSCKNNLFLAINSQNDHAICVKSDTLIKLHDRGWANNSDELGKVWMELSPITCIAYDCDIEWLNSYDLESSNWPNAEGLSNYNCILQHCLEGTSVAVKDHYGKLGINILDIKYEAHPHPLIGEFGESSILHSLFFLIPSSDLTNALKEGLVINPENIVGRNGVFPETWTFASEDVIPYWIVNRNYFYSDENCSGYILRPDGNPMPSAYHSFIQRGQANIDFENCPFYEQSEFQINQLANILDVIESTNLTNDQKLDYFQLIGDEKFAPTISDTDRNLFQQIPENYHKGEHVRLLREKIPDSIMIQRINDHFVNQHDFDENKLLENISLLRELVPEQENDKHKVIELFKNTPEVKAFHMQYEDAQFSVRDDYVSYFSGSDDGYLVRMNLYFDENYVLGNTDFHCYYQKVHQFELAQEDLATKIEKYDCEEIADLKNEN